MKWFCCFLVLKLNPPTPPQCRWTERARVWPIAWPVACGPSGCEVIGSGWGNLRREEYHQCLIPTRPASWKSQPFLKQITFKQLLPWNINGAQVTRPSGSEPASICKLIVAKATHPWSQELHEEVLGVTFLHMTCKKDFYPRDPFSYTHSWEKINGTTMGFSLPFQKQEDFTRGYW